MMLFKRRAQNGIVPKFWANKLTKFTSTKLFQSQITVHFPKHHFRPAFLTRQYFKIVKKRCIENPTTYFSVKKWCRNYKTESVSLVVFFFSIFKWNVFALPLDELYLYSHYNFPVHHLFLVVGFCLQNAWTFPLNFEWGKSQENKMKIKRTQKLMKANSVRRMLNFVWIIAEKRKSKITLKSKLAFIIFHLFDTNVIVSIIVAGNNVRKVIKLNTKNYSVDNICYMRCDRLCFDVSAVVTNITGMFRWIAARTQQKKKHNSNTYYECNKFYVK